MGQVLHGSATTAEAVRRAIQNRCRIPDAHLSKRIWKLTLAREGLGKLLVTLKAQSK